MDPMQSAQISSSQGFADGQNSATKDSKLSDSFLSSSPVSLIQSPQDKRVVLGSDKPSEGVATSLRFPSQPGSFSPGNYGSEGSGPPDGQPDSPIKTSPVSERIKALEALAAKKSEPENRSDGAQLHFKERHYEKSPTEAPAEAPPVFQKKVGSTDQESPESPFEVLGDARQGSEFEDTAEWMRAHLPPVPDFDDAVDSRKCSLVSGKTSKSHEIKGANVVIPDVPAAFAGVPDAFMDSPVEPPKLKDQDSAKQPSVEEEAEFDMSFLPTAYMCDKQKKPDIHTPLTEPDSEPTPSPAPPVGFHSPSPPPSPPTASDPKQKVSETKKTLCGGDMEPLEVAEVDSSGESDDTVIEDAASVPAPSIPAPSPSNLPTPAPSAPSSSSLSTEESQPVKQDKQPMQVPTINVIETEEPNYSDEEMEMEIEEEEDESYEVVKDPVKEAPTPAEPQPKVTKMEPSKIPPLESEFMGGYSPPSSPVDSDPEYSPQHKVLKPGSDQAERQSAIDDLQHAAVSKGPSSDVSQTQPDKTQTSKEADETSSTFTAKPSIKTVDVDFPDNDDEWSDDAPEVLGQSDLAKVVARDLPQSTTSKMDEKPSGDIKQEYMETVAPLRSTFMQDDMTARYDRQSFDDYDAPPGFDDYDDKLKDFDYDTVTKPSDPTSQIHIETLLPLNSATTELTDMEEITSMTTQESFVHPVGAQPSHMEFPKDPYSTFQSEPQSSVKEPVTDLKKKDNVVPEDMVNSETILPHKVVAKAQKDTKVDHRSPDTTSDPESIEPECSVSAATDSFVEFMRECLKSQQDEEPEDLSQGLTTKHELPKTGASQNPPTMVMDLEQERLTISALKDLGSSQKEEEDLQSHVKASSASNLGKSQSSFTSNPIPSSPQTKPASDSSSYSKEVEAIDQWVAEAYHLAEHVLTAILTHLSVKDLVHWRDPKKSGVVFGLSMLLLLSLAAFSVISVVSYLLLALLCVTITFRIYKSVVQAVQKSGDGHPFNSVSLLRSLMDKDLSIPPETFRKNVDVSLSYINRGLKQLSRLFLVEDLVDSLKLAVVMWLFTYVGAVFNGITILILADILLFSVPPVYEKNKTQIDQYIDLARTQVNTTIAKLQEKLPGAGKRSKAE
ncbi:reticulon-3 isoform X1 [Osmerus eperlanus]|uniref:reticulon-3 isoform X1 n=1 Tax=Osmerus eperlanus TaxID=29151 RepID=UPI002E0F1549